MPTYPNESWPADASVEMLDGATDPATGLPYIAKGTGPTSTPSLEVQYNRREQRLNRILAGWRQGMVVDEGNLKIGVYPITFTLGGSRKAFDGATGVTVPDNSAKVVYLDSSASLVTADVWPANLTTFLSLAIVSTSGGQITIEDVRVFTAFHVPSLEASGINDRRIVTAHCASIAANQSDAQVFAYDAPQDLTLAEVQVYCGSITATATVNVKAAGVSLLSAPATPSAASIVKPAVSTPGISAGSRITVHVTTNGTGSIANLTVTLLLKAAPAA